MQYSTRIGTQTLGHVFVKAFTLFVSLVVNHSTLVARTFAVGDVHIGGSHARYLNSVVDVCPHLWWSSGVIAHVWLSACLVEWIRDTCAIMG